MEFIHNAIVVGIVLKPTTRINHARDTEAVQLPEEQPRGIELVFARQLRPLGQCGVENVRIRPRDEKTGRIAVPVALNFAGRKIRGVSCRSRPRAAQPRSTKPGRTGAERKTGVSGAAALISSSVGIRRSAN